VIFTAGGTHVFPIIDEVVLVNVSFVVICNLLLKLQCIAIMFMS